MDRPSVDDSCRFLFAATAGFLTTGDFLLTVLVEKNANDIYFSTVTQDKHGITRCNGTVVTKRAKGNVSGKW